MVRVSVITKNEIGRYIFKFGIVAIILFFLAKIYEYSKKNLLGKQVTTEQCLAYLSDEITELGNNKNGVMSKVSCEEIIGSELRMSMAVSSRNIETALEDNNESANSIAENNESALPKDEENHVEKVSDHLETEVIPSKYKDTYNFEIGSVKIKNETAFDLYSMNLDENISVDNKNVIIYHTHTCESYTPSDTNPYEMEGNYRTTDLDYTVAKVGDELEKYLSAYGFSVIHDKTYHDYPAYTGSYGRSLSTVSNIMQNCDKTDILIDLHRDAMGDDSYAPKVKIGDEYAAQIMFVIGTDGSRFRASKLET